LRVSGLRGTEELLVAPRFIRTLSGGRLTIAVTALPHLVWHPFEVELESRGVPVLGLHTMESCLALAAPATREETGVLEYNAGRARFVLSADGAPLHVRRFILGASEGGLGATVAQLALELPRTLDWLRESGLQEPKSLVVGSRLGVAEGSDEMAMLQGGLEKIGKPAIDYSVGDGVAEPGLATLMLLSQIDGAGALPSLLAKPSVRVPWGKMRYASVAATAVFGFGLSWSAVMDSNARAAVELERAGIDAQVAEVEMALTEAEDVAVPSGETAVARERLDLALSMRRPISRLLAEISNCATPQIHIATLEFSSADHVSIAGMVKTESRAQALKALAGFVNRVRAIPYLKPGGQDEVTEIPGLANCLRFQLALSWRFP